MAERIIEFEGRRISVPADATDDEIASILETPAPKAQAAPTGNNDPTGLLATIMRAQKTGQSTPDSSTFTGVGTQFARGARKGIANIAGIPIDAINNAPRLANLLPGVDGFGPISEQPFMGSEYIDKQLLGLGGAIPEPPKAVGAAERVARRVGEEVGAAAVPVGGALAAARGMTVNQARNLPGLARMFVEPTAVAPGKFVGDNVTAALLAGGGASAVNESGLGNGIDPTTGAYNPGLADVVGAVGGVGAGAVAAGLARPLGTAVSAAMGRPQFIDGVVKEVAVDEIARAAGVQPNARGVVNTDPLVDQIMGARRVGDTVPGYQESLGDRLKNQGIANLEYGRATGDNRGMFAERNTQNIEAVDQAMTGVKPTEQPGALRSELEIRRDQALNEALAARQAAEQQAQAAVAPITPQTTPAQRGNVIREDLTTARDAARARTAQAYDEAEIRGRQVNPEPLAETLDQSVAGLTVAERAVIPQDLIDGVASLGRPTEAGAPGPMRIEEATTLRTRLQEMRTAANADPARRSEARVLGRLSEQVDSYIQSNLTPDEIAKLDAARGAKFAEAEAFDRKGDPVARALSEYQGGRPRVADDRVAGLFATPENMDVLFKQANTPATQRALRDEILARANTASAETIERFRADNAGQIAKFPGLDNELNAAITARRAEAGAVQGEAKLTRELGTPTQRGTGPVGQILWNDQDKVDQAFRGILTGGRAVTDVDAVLNFANNEPKAVEGARRAFWNFMESRSRRSGETTATVNGTQPWMGGALKKFLEENSAVAERLYKDNPEHLNRIREIADTLQGVNLSLTQRAPNTSGTAQGTQSVLPTAETIASRVFAVQRGVVSPTFAAANVVGIIARKATKQAQVKAVNMMVDKALTDPDFAAQLLKENNPANKAALARSARSWMGNEASTLINLLDEDDDADVKQKVMEK